MRSDGREYIPEDDEGRETPAPPITPLDSSPDPRPPTPDPLLGPLPGDITIDGARRAFHDHLIDKANAARLKYGLYIDTETILRMLDDREVVRYPTTIVFDASPLQPHEFAFPQPLGFHASDGYALCLHPGFRTHREIWPLLIAYHVPVINYGDIVDAEGAELYGATLLGLDPEAYYGALCELADSEGLRTES